MEQILQLIQQGNMDLQTGLEALIKATLENGQSMEVAIQALIKQAQDQDLQPVLEALIRLQQVNHSELVEVLKALKPQEKPDDEIEITVNII